MVAVVVLAQGGVVAVLAGGGGWSASAAARLEPERRQRLAELLVVEMARPVLVELAERAAQVPTGARDQATLAVGDLQHGVTRRQLRTQPRRTRLGTRLVFLRLHPRRRPCLHALHLCAQRAAWRTALGRVPVAIVGAHGAVVVFRDAACAVGAIGRRGGPPVGGARAGGLGRRWWLGLFAGWKRSQRGRRRAWRRRGWAWSHLDDDLGRRPRRLRALDVPRSLLGLVRAAAPARRTNAFSSCCRWRLNQLFREVVVWSTHVHELPGGASHRARRGGGC